MASGEKDDGEKTLLGCVAVLFMLPFSIAWKAFVAVQLWGWFLVPLGAPRVGLAHAVGLMLVATMATVKPTKSDFDDEPAGAMAARAVVYGFIMPAIALAFGWLASAAMAAGY